MPFCFGECALDLERRELRRGPELVHIGQQVTTYAKLGKLDAAKSAAARVLELQPGFTFSGMCASFDVHPSVAGPLSEALIAARLPASIFARRAPTAIVRVGRSRGRNFCAVKIVAAAHHVTPAAPVV